MTNLVTLRTVEEFMADFKPVYQPIFPLFLPKSTSYASEAGQHEFKRLDTVGDIRNRDLTPKDTEIKQIAVHEKSKYFKKYFSAGQFQQSAFQDRKGVEDVNAQVLDENNKKMDDFLLLGGATDGTTNTIKNNGLYLSLDANYELESSVEIDTDADPLISLHSNVMANVADADDISGRKLILFYGAQVKSYFNGVYSSQPVPFKDVLGKIIQPKGYSMAELPSDVTPANVNGWIIINLDQVKLHYTVLPSLWNQGVNEEKLYAWSNFLMGSCMLEVLVDEAVIRQPATIEA